MVRVAMSVGNSRSAWISGAVSGAARCGLFMRRLRLSLAADQLLLGGVAADQDRLDADEMRVHRGARRGRIVRRDGAIDRLVLGDGGVALLRAAARDDQAGDRAHALEHRRVHLGPALVHDGGEDIVVARDARCGHGTGGRRRDAPACPARPRSSRRSRRWRRSRPRVASCAASAATSGSMVRRAAINSSGEEPTPSNRRCVGAVGCRPCR